MIKPQNHPQDSTIAPQRMINLIQVVLLVSLVCTINHSVKDTRMTYITRIAIVKIIVIGI